MLTPLARDSGQKCLASGRGEKNAILALVSLARCLIILVFLLLSCDLLDLVLILAGRLASRSRSLPLNWPGITDGSVGSQGR